MGASYLVLFSNIVVGCFGTTSIPAESDMWHVENLENLVDARKDPLMCLCMVEHHIAEGEEHSSFDTFVDRALKGRRFHRASLDSSTLGKLRTLPRDSDNRQRSKALSADISANIVKDAIGGDARTVATAAAVTSVMEAVVFLPINSVQTRMQASGVRLPGTLRNVFRGGAVDGVRQLYKALPPNAAMIMMRDGLIFGSGALIKKRVPDDWPEIVRDAVSMGLSALICTACLFPVDTVKTRMQLGNSMPKPGQLYWGFAPAATDAVVSRAMWMAARNGLGRNLADLQNESVWKNLVVGGLCSTMVTSTVFPLETLKKRLQSSEGIRRNVISEAFTLFKEGGIRRLYRGIPLKLTTHFFEGALFNAMFVECGKSLEALKNKE